MKEKLESIHFTYLEPTFCLHLLRRFLTGELTCIFSTRVIHFVCLKFTTPPAHIYLPLTWVGMLLSVEIRYYADWYTDYINALGAGVFLQLIWKWDFREYCWSLVRIFPCFNPSLNPIHKCSQNVGSCNYEWTMTKGDSSTAQWKAPADVNKSLNLHWVLQIREFCT